MTRLASILDEHEIKQVEVAAALGVSEAAISKMLKGGFDPRKERIDSLLEFLSGRLNRPVTYEEVFGAPLSPAANQ